MRMHTSIDHNLPVISCEKKIYYFICSSHYFKQLGLWPIPKKKKQKKKKRLLAVVGGWKIESITGKALERLKTFDAFDQSRIILGIP